ncbi:MDR family MFS transporter [Tessaracoccus oleiagri]|uniref:MFS transporter, DHA2 family, lincomycin resistance protein n=1 Tax=Tessaracoccus oleiagri TaxID=686624 RepID=A0A1G9H986_9ACTN|nr:MDR family MFS transporter [Tessaracoccus oleiagri]SDL09427.1 MFS transporter, DHA2 family, lincomycin resistance protein [Tessaracoccus oleiagri]
MPRTEQAIDQEARADTVETGGRVIWLLLAAAFVAILNETTMGVAIPHLIADLGITYRTAQWLTTAFMLTMAIVIPTTGFLIQRFTTRQVFVAAMILFSTGTTMAMLAPAWPVLIAARVVQASGTAMMLPLLMTTIMMLVPAHRRGAMMGRVSIVIAFAPAIGPVLSGFVLDVLSWRWIFAIVLPIALTALAVGARWIRNVGRTTDAPLDVPSVILSAFGFGGLVFALSQISGAESGGAAADVALARLTLAISLAVGAVALVLFVWRQIRLQRDDRALLDLRVFQNTNFALSMAQFAVMSFAFFGAITVVPLYLQEVHGLSALQSGLVVLPGSIAMGLAGPIIGNVYDRWGTRVLLMPGAVLVTAMLWFYTTLDADTAVPVIVVAQTLLAVGLAMSFTPLSTAALASLTRNHYSHGSAVLGTVQQVAGAAGVAVMVTVAAAASGGGGTLTSDGTQTAFLFSAVAATPLVLGAWLIRKPADDAGPIIAAH